MKIKHNFLSGDRKNRNGSCTPLLLVVLFFYLAGCSVTTPKLDKHFFPESYSLEQMDSADLVTISESVRLIRLNRNPDLNHRVLSFWREGALSGAFHRVQPITRIYGDDMANLSIFLDQILQVYLVAISSQEPISTSQLKKILIGKLHCNPMTNLEIRFLMNSNSPEPFSKKPLTMLLISSHELALQAGAEPVYPRLYSPYLRKAFHLAPLKNLETFNLFATKKKNEVYSGSRSGFIVCHQQTDNHEPKSAGPP